MKEFMRNLVAVRAKLRRIFAAADPYLVMGMKAVTALIVLLSVNAAFPYRAVLSRGLIVAAVSLLCSILPWTYITVFGMLFLLGQLSAMSMEACVFVLVIAVALAVLSYLTLPGCGILWALLPVLLSWKIPAAAVLLAGLFGGITAFISVGSGTVLYFILKLIKDNAAVLTGAETAAASGAEVKTLVQRLLLLVEGVLKNEELIIVLIVFSLTALLVHLISRTEVDYAKEIAVGAGTVFCPVLLIVACRFAEVEISVGMTLLSTFIGLIAALGAEFLAVGLDYPRTEKVQFEDDDYYYFVKAVPKLKLPEDKARSEAEAAQQLRRAAAQAEKGSE